MPTDHASGSVVVPAAVAHVLAVLRAVESQPEWVPQITAAELLEEYEDGTPATAAFVLSTAIGTDRFTLEYEHADDAMTWTLVTGSMLKAQDGGYRLRDLGDGSTEVRLDLTVEHSIAAPGFLRRKVFGGFVDGALAGLRSYLQPPPCA